MDLATLYMNLLDRRRIRDGTLRSRDVFTRDQGKKLERGRRGTWL